MTLNSRDLAYASIDDVSKLIERRELSPVEVLDNTLARIDELEDTINAYIHVFADEARAQAQAAEAEIKSGAYRGPLHGIPVCVKDIYESGPTTCGSRSLLGYEAPEDCPSVANLKVAGAIVIGKTETYEFAYGFPTNASHFKPTHNPWNLDHECGGSSSGTGGAVAAGMAYAGMGSCTGGSIRWPAFCTGIVGLKGTYGRVSRRGVFPLSWTLDHTGPLARTVTDAAHMLRGCAGYDPQDPASANVPVPDFTSKIGRDIKGMKIGLIKELYEDNCDPKVKKPYDEALKVFEGLGAELVEVPGLTVRQMQAIEWPTLFSEAASIHIRNQRGPRVKEYNPHTWQFLQYGLLVSAGYYHNAQRARAQVRDSFLKSLNEKADVLMTPTVGFPVPPILDESPGLSIVAGDFTVYTAIFNQSGLPAMQVPCGFDDDGLPVGLQIAGKPFDEETVCQVGYAYEQEAGWIHKHPDM